jgi:methanogenic corrinoid protein MtbC1
LRRVGQHPLLARRPLRTTRRVLLLPADGEQHTFGLSMIAQFFLHAGWDVRRTARETHSALCHIVRDEWFDIVGFTASCSGHLESIKANVHGIRRVSRNRSIRIFVGGRAFDSHPERAFEIGADLYAPDGPQAVMRAEALVSVAARYA